MSDTNVQTVITEPVPKRKARAKAKLSKPAKAAKATDTGKLDQFGFRLGSLKARAAALYATKKGATLGEIKTQLKSTQFNVLTELEHKGYKVERNPVLGFNDRKVTRYHVVVK